jgi:glycosyltransferase involved in cell wall biosynthesis
MKPLVKRLDVFLAMMGWLWGGNVMVKVPLLSICIPAYNRPLWLRRGLESVAVGNGVYTSWVEVVITDDSDRREGEVIAGEVLGGWHYRYEHHERPLGMAQNWNRAIALARGQYVMVLHDDDFFIPGGLGQLRRGRWLGFQQVMGLFELPELKPLACPLQWQFLKGMFSILSKGLKG